MQSQEQSLSIAGYDPKAPPPQYDEGQLGLSAPLEAQTALLTPSILQSCALTSKAEATSRRQHTNFWRSLVMGRAEGRRKKMNRKSPHPHLPCLRRVCKRTPLKTHTATSCQRLPASPGCADLRPEKPGESEEDLSGASPRLTHRTPKFQSWQCPEEMTWSKSLCFSEPRFPSLKKLCQSRTPVMSY